MKPKRSGDVPAEGRTEPRSGPAVCERFGGEGSGTILSCEQRAGWQNNFPLSLSHGNDNRGGVHTDHGEDKAVTQELHYTYCFICRFTVTSRIPQ